MRTPFENQEGYKNASPLEVADKLKGKVLLIHGADDDNVHLQNTIQMVNAFFTSGRRFDLMLYPRKTHSIAGQEARTDLFTRMEELFKKELVETPQERP